jgi:hypothetical protein
MGESTGPSSVPLGTPRARFLSTALGRVVRGMGGRFAPVWIGLVVFLAGCWWTTPRPRWILRLPPVYAFRDEDPPRWTRITDEVPVEDGRIGADAARTGFVLHRRGRPSLAPRRWHGLIKRVVPKSTGRELTDARSVWTWVDRTTGQARPILSLPDDVSGLRRAVPQALLPGGLVVVRGFTGSSERIQLKVWDLPTRESASGLSAIAGISAALILWLSRRAWRRAPPVGDLPLDDRPRVAPRPWPLFALRAGS